MNKYIQTFLDDNNLKVHEEFKIDNSSKVYYFSEDSNLRYTLPSDGYHYFANNLAELLNGNYKIKKLSNIPTEKFIPEENEGYWFVSHYGHVICNQYYNDEEDKYILTHNHIFQAKAEAQDYKWFLDKVDEYKKPFVPGKDNLYFYCDCDDKKVYEECHFCYQSQGVVYFGDEENISKFLEEVGEERIKKYMFDIWN